ncbi:MAG TPA: type II toxin-antitoxin system RelE/ParE family toxin [Planctomycetaceae bacterium]|nr:type II toxin-antitoxin system RelE/ParE family toxin [Planctomycetaceae bacterium]
MMTYSVIVTDEAKENLRCYYRYAAIYAPEPALRWLARFEAALATLAVNPQRCPHAPENDRVTYEVREFLFGRRRSAFRALFTITSDEVRILHVRRAAMDWANPEDLQG